jgi:hypothetical protein
MEKYVETSKPITENVMRNASRCKEERDALAKQSLKDRFRRKFKRECTPKEIRRQITELRKEKKLLESKKDYRPNIKGIQYVFVENASEIKQ